MQSVYSAAPADWAKLILCHIFPLAEEASRDIFMSFLVYNSANMIWIRHLKSIFYDDNHYVTYVSLIIKSNCK